RMSGAGLTVAVCRQLNACDRLFPERKAFSYFGSAGTVAPRLTLRKPVLGGPPLDAPRNNGGNIIATPVLGGLHHIYNLAAGSTVWGFCALQCNSHSDGRTSRTVRGRIQSRSTGQH